MDLFELDRLSSIILSVLLLPILFYPLLFETLMHGQTPGKFLTKIRVTNVDGSTPNFLSYFLRWVLLPIDLFPYGGIGTLFILFTKNHQRLGDLAAGTTVVKRIPSSAKYDLDPVFNEFPPDYKPAFPQADMLSEGQIRLISELLDNSADSPALDNLASKIRQKLHIEADGMNSRLFLETLLRDYNYFATMGI
jgi:hypothetical protein